MKTLACLVALQLSAMACVIYHAWELHERAGYPHRIAMLGVMAFVLGAAWSSLYDVYKLRKYMWTLSRKAAARRTTQAKARAAVSREYHS